MQASLDIFDLLFYKFLQALASFSGINVFVADYKMSAMGYFLFGNIIMAFICSIYTIYTYDLATKLACMTLIILTVQGFVKFLTVDSYHKEIRETVEFLRSIYVANTSIVTESTILMKWSVRFMLLTKSISGVISAAGSIAFVLPIIVYVWTNEIIPIAPIYIPFVDESTTRGFITLILVQMMWNCQVVVGMMGVDSLLTIFNVYLFMMIDLFDHLLVQLNYELTANPKIGRSKEVASCVSNLVMMHQQICNYLDTITDIFAVNCFFELNSDGFGLCFIIFSLMAIDDVWLSLYAVFIVILGKLFIICVLGTLVEIATDRLLDTIQRSKWYLLPPSLQMNFQLMIQRAQHPTAMMAGTTPLNLDTFVNVIKSVYSFTMVMDEMLH